MFESHSLDEDFVEENAQRIAEKDFFEIDGDRSTPATEFGMAQTNSAAYAFVVDNYTEKMAEFAGQALVETIKEGDYSREEIENTCNGLYDMINRGIEYGLEEVEHLDLVGVTRDGEVIDKEVYSEGQTEQCILKTAAEYTNEVMEKVVEEDDDLIMEEDDEVTFQF